jgi:23S rRNA A2030 N6-methylase RlmJ
MYEQWKGLPRDKPEGKMPLKTPSREEFKVEGDEVTHVPTGKAYRAYPGSAEIANENVADVDDYRESDIREIAKQLLSERVRITERLR